MDLMLRHRMEIAGYKSEGIHSSSDQKVPTLDIGWPLGLNNKNKRSCHQTKKGKCPC